MPTTKKRTKAGRGTKGEGFRATERSVAVVPATCNELRALQRYRATLIKSRNMIFNRLLAIVAGTLGYASNLTEKQREKLYQQAREVIQKIRDGDAGEKHVGLVELVQAHYASIDAMVQQQSEIEKEQLALVKKLPIYKWVQQPEQRGFGLQYLATVIGECGDLSNYANPAKVWKRMGCAPCEHNGKTLMGSTWRRGKEGKLPAEVWESFGYCPRRRSIAYLIGEGLMKQNFTRDKETEKTIWMGPYRKRYEEARERYDELHPECREKGKQKRSQLHGMLLATKLLLKNLWIEWNR